LGRALAIGLLAMVIMVCPVATAAPRTLPLSVETYRLSNGLLVVLAPDPSQDEVSVVVHYAVGSSDDPVTKPGLAHLVEHLMFDGSRHVGPGDFWRWIARVGASGFNGTTTLDATNYFVTVPNAGLSTVLWLESDRMGLLAERLNQQTLDIEKRIIADEARDKILDHALGVVGPISWREIFPAWHPYHRAGSAATADSCTLDDVRAFLRTWYAPSNATLGVTGGFDVAKTRALIDQYFGDLPSTDPPTRPDLPVSWPSHDVRIDAGAGIPQDIVSFTWLTPALDHPGDPALDLAAAILADPNGRLRRELVGGGLALWINARQESCQRASRFWITVGAVDGADEQLMARIDRAVSDLAQTVSPGEFRRARDEYSDQLLFHLETPLGRAGELVRKPAKDPPWNLGKYDDLTATDVAASVRANLVTDHRVVIVVHHGPSYPSQGVILARNGVAP
jgi:predicted Zn-dependent peptidase